MDGGTAAQATTLQQYEVNGIPVLWRHDVGETWVALAFDVGWADEPLPLRGITHLAEHLVLAPLGKGTCEFNGATEPHRTTFFASGTPEDAVSFLSTVCHQISDGDFVTHIEDQRRMLAAEATRNPGWIGERHDVRRWGARGLGVGIYHELAVPLVSVERVRDWVGQRFVTGAAVLMGSGPMPEALPLALPPGGPTHRLAAKPAVPTPSTFSCGSEFVSFSGLVPRSAVSSIGTGLLVDRLVAELRYQRAITYGVDAALDVVDADTCRLVIRMDAVPDHSQEVADAALHVVQGLTESAVDVAELAKAVDRGRTPPEAKEAELWARASALSRGRPYVAHNQELDEIVTAGPGVIRNWMATFAATTMWCLPEAVTLNALQPVPTQNHRAIDGKRYLPAKGQIQRRYYVVGDGGISFVDELADVPDETVTIDWAGCAAVLGYPDGGRIIVGADSSSITAHPSWSADGSGLVSDIDKRIPPGLYVPMPLPMDPAPMEQPTIAVDPGMSDGSLRALGILMVVLAATSVLVGVTEGMPFSGLTGALACLAIASWPLFVLRRRRKRRAAGIMPQRIQRYRGVETWSRAGLQIAVAGGGILFVLGVIGLKPLPLIGGAILAFRAGRELSKR